MKQLSWKFDVWNANKSTLLNTITNTTPGGLSGGFRWQLKPDGDTVQLEFSGRNDRLKLPPRGVVALTVDGQPAFYGVVPDPPSAASPNIEQAQVLGGREALRVALMDGTVYRQQGVYQIVRDILSRLRPPALAYDPAQIGDGTGMDLGPGLDLYYSPTMPLTDALDGLAKSAGTTWGVDAQGRVFFGQPSPAALNVAYAGQPWRRLPVQGRETVTRAVLRVVSGPAGMEAEERRAFTAGAWTDYLPATVTKVATHAQHAQYRAEVSMPVPDGMSAAQNGGRVLGGVVQFLNPGNAVDDDPATYAESAARADVDMPTLNVVNRVAGQRPIGVRVRYSVQNRQDADQVKLWVEHFHTGVGGGSERAVYDLPNDKYIREETIIFPPQARPGATYQQLTVSFRLFREVFGPSDTFGAGVIRVYDVQPLIVDEAAAQRIAESFLHVPSASPAEITLRGLTPPTPTVTVTGSPDGDVTGSASLYEYTHTPEQPRTTRVKIGADGQSGAARAIRWAVRAGG